MRLLAGKLDGYRLDSKGRLSIPTKWRERVGKEFYLVGVTIHGCRCLNLYPEEKFNQVYDSLNQGTENQKYDILASFFDDAEEIVADAQGRFTVAQRLKDNAGLTNNSDVVFRGMGQYIEIWSADEFEKLSGGFDRDKGVYDLIDDATAGRE